MGKYEQLWKHIQKEGKQEILLTFDEIKELAGIDIDHSFLHAKKELLTYGYQVDKISLKQKTVLIHKLKKE